MLDSQGQSQTTQDTPMEDSLETITVRVPTDTSFAPLLDPPHPSPLLLTRNYYSQKVRITAGERIGSYGFAALQQKQRGLVPVTLVHDAVGWRPTDRVIWKRPRSLKTVTPATPQTLETLPIAPHTPGTPHTGGRGYCGKTTGRERGSGD